MTEEERLQQVARDQPPFANLIGVRLVSAIPDRIVFELPVTPALANRNGVLHGGALMTLADNAGGTGAFMNLPEGSRTITLESKTNFTRAIRVGDVARATAVPLHVGGRTQIWQTTISRGDGKLAAIVTQTQMVIDWAP